MSESENPKPFVNSEYNIIRFGKYKGTTFRDLLDEDPDYLRWAIDNIEWLHVSEAIKLELWPIDQETGEVFNKDDTPKFRR